MCACSFFKTKVFACMLELIKKDGVFAFSNFDKQNRGLCVQPQLSPQRCVCVCIQKRFVCAFSTFGVCAFSPLTTGVCVCMFNFHNQGVYVHVQLSQKKCVCALSTFTTKVCVCAFSTFTAMVRVCILNLHYRRVCIPKIHNRC